MDKKQLDRMREGLKRYKEKVSSGEIQVKKQYSRTKAMKAFCFECLGGELLNDDCMAVSCPLYVFRKQSKLEPDLWWEKPRSDWYKLIHGFRRSNLKKTDLTLGDIVKHCVDNNVNVNVTFKERKDSSVLDSKSTLSDSSSMVESKGEKKQVIAPIGYFDLRRFR